jgi:3-hydroxyacyl-[acyl-carrier-protein] dehydratase
MPPELIMDPLGVDTSKVVCDREGLRAINPQRFEMEQLDAIVYIDSQAHVCIGYKDVRPDEFWVRGHMPGYPLLPGVLICEAAAQLVAYYTATHGFKLGDFLGFGGMENVRFRGTVRPGDRLLLIGKGLRLNRRQTIFNVQGFVGKALVFHADVIGVQMSKRDISGGEEES